MRQYRRAVAGALSLSLSAVQSATRQRQRIEHAEYIRRTAVARARVDQPAIRQASNGRAQAARTEIPAQTMVSVSLLFFVTLSFELTMNQLFCVDEAPSLTVLATPSDWHVDELRASAPPRRPRS